MDIISYISYSAGWGIDEGRRGRRKKREKEKTRNGEGEKEKE
jgi:hypothetical protein